MIQNKQYMEQHKNFGRVQAMPRLCWFYPEEIEEKAQKNLSQGSHRVPAGMMKIHKTYKCWNNTLKGCDCFSHFLVTSSSVLPLPLTMQKQHKANQELLKWAIIMFSFRLQSFWV
jgi:hypothetical protein